MSGETLVAAFATARYQNWMRTALQGEFDVVSSADPTLEDLVRLLDSTGSGVAFVEIDRERMTRQASLIEGLAAARPAVAIVALADDTEPGLVLSAMRAGARDFITPASRTSELTGLIRRLNASRPADVVDLEERRDQRARIVAVYGARPGTDTVTFCLQLARALPHRRRKQVEADEVLLVDLGTPVGDVVDCLGATPEFGFLDAIRNLRRLDGQMLDGALHRHGDGLRVLAMLPDDDALGDVSSAELYLLLGTLRRYYRRVVVNLGGVPDSEFLHVMLSNTDHLLWMIDQSVSSCRQNLAVLRKVRDAEILPAQVRLLVDRYNPKVPPAAQTLADSFGLPLAGTLPAEDQARLLLRNTGRALDEQQSRDPYHRKVRQIARELFAPREATGLAGRLRRLIG